MKKQFTLIELLIVIAIIAILAGMLLPALGGAKKMVERIVCASNQKQVFALVNMYSNDFNSVIPAGRILYSNTESAYIMQYILSEHKLIRVPSWQYTDVPSPKFIFCPSVDYSSIHGKTAAVRYDLFAYYGWGYLGASYGMGLIAYGGYDASKSGIQWLRDGKQAYYMTKVRRPGAKAYLTEAVDPMRFAGSYGVFSNYLPGNAKTDEDMISGRHMKSCNIAWLDGHVSQVDSREQALHLKNTPEEQNWFKSYHN